MTIYKPDDPWIPGQFPSILAIGDSWFWYPKNNVLQALIENPALKSDHGNIQMLGYNGATIAQYVDRNNVRGRYAKAFKHELRENCGYYSAIMISGGGNDAVDYRLGLQRDCTGKTAADDCIDAEGLDDLVRGIAGAIGLMMHDIAWAFGRKENRMPDVFLHGYDYPVPDGRGFTLAGLRFSGPWLASAMDQRKVAADMVLRTAIAKRLIDEMNTAIAGFDKVDDRIHYIDCRGALRRDTHYQDDWDNELHPTFSGFKTVVEKKWIPVLRREGYAT